jgi:hypothetical protein
MDYAKMATQAGCLPAAVPDVERRVQAHFPEGASPETVQQWLEGTLRRAAPHLFQDPPTVWGALGMSQEHFNAMPPSWRLAQARAHQAPVTRPHPRRPVPKDAPEDVRAAWKDLPLVAQLTAYRAWRDSQG